MTRSIEGWFNGSGSEIREERNEREEGYERDEKEAKKEVPKKRSPRRRMRISSTLSVSEVRILTVRERSGLLLQILKV